MSVSAGKKEDGQTGNNDTTTVRAVSSVADLVCDLLRVDDPGDIRSIQDFVTKHAVRSMDFFAGDVYAHMIRDAPLKRGAMGMRWPLAFRLLREATDLIHGKERGDLNCKRCNHAITAHPCCFCAGLGRVSSAYGECTRCGCKKECLRCDDHFEKDLALLGEDGYDTLRYRLEGISFAFESGGYKCCGQYQID